MARRATSKCSTSVRAESYRHPEAESPLRPEVGTQAQFKKRKPPAKSLWTSRDVRDVVHSHLNYVVADTKKWEQSAAYTIDTHRAVAAFVKNSGLGFAIPYVHNGQSHDYVPDFIARLAGAPDRYLILETKGFDELAEVKAAAARRWVAAVNADGKFGNWQFAMARSLAEVRDALDRAGESVTAAAVV